MICVEDFELVPPSSPLAGWVRLGHHVWRTSYLFYIQHGGGGRRVGGGGGGGGGLNSMLAKLLISLFRDPEPVWCC